MRIIVKNSDIGTIDQNPHMLRLAVLGYGLREFWVMLCVKNPPNHIGTPPKGKVFIEEYVPTSIDLADDVFGNLKYIDDNNLAEDLARFAQDKKIIDMAERLNEAGETGKLDLMMQ